MADKTPRVAGRRRPRSARPLSRRQRAQLYLKDPPWWFREGVLAVLTGLAVGVVLLVGQMVLDDRRAVRAEQLENLRFVRERSSDDPDLDRPFVGFDLRGQNLGGLKLVGADFTGVNLSGGYLSDADLTDASLNSAVLTDADLNRAHLTGADLAWADLTSAYLDLADLRGADLTFADLPDATLRRADRTDANLGMADLTGADLRGADLTGVCYSATTAWPARLEPPPSDPRGCPGS